MSFIGKLILKWVLRALENKYPGLAFIVDKVIALLEGGATAPQIKAHLDGLNGY